MIGQNEINVQEELANKANNPTVSYKHRIGRLLVQIKYDACTIIPYPTVEEKHI